MSEKSEALPIGESTTRASPPPPQSTDQPLSATVPRVRLLQDWKQAYERAHAYVDALGVPETQRDELTARAVEHALDQQTWAPDTHATAETLRAIERLLLDASPHDTAPESRLEDFAAWRLETALSGTFSRRPATRPAAPAPAPIHRRLRSMPRFSRGTMIPHTLERRGLRYRITPSSPSRRSPSGPDPDAARTAGRAEMRAIRDHRRQLPWTAIANRRRALLGLLVLFPSIVASGFMADVLPHQAGTPLEVAIVVFFGMLFGWISIGFWTAILGFFTLTWRRDRFRITRAEAERASDVDPSARTAIVMPVCEEPVHRVFAGMKAMSRSLEQAGALRHFDFFVLSDTADPSTWVKEEEAWLDWCRSARAFDRVFYRRRRVRVKRKSGNVADFCRRWGAQYRYMIVLDADSVMTGDTLVRLVGLMEAHPDVGMIQTAPSVVNRQSLFARVQQFASRVYGPMFAAGLHFWQLGDGQYWGHNAIIRVAPFMEHCGLPRLPGKPPLGGEILSHDFVEAALMGRAGWTLWLAFDLPGSYEEAPSSLLQEMKRDRRWCQGNLQHLRLLAIEGLFGAHRALFLNGVLSYVSALLWFCFLSLSTAEAILEAVREPEYFPSGPSLFPEWPIWRPDWALWLVAVTAMILFLPKVLSVLLILFKLRTGHLFGGAARLWLSTVLEILVSSLFAPIRMLFHTKFVLLNLIGRTVAWRSQDRGDSETTWPEALRHHGLDTLLATAWGTGVYWLNPEYFWWLTPIVAALILSVPLSVHASRLSLGRQARNLGLFLIPEETSPPPELLDLQRSLRAAEDGEAALPPAERDGYVRSIVDPYVNAVHRALLGGHRSLAPAIRVSRRTLLERTLADGPGALTLRERRILLADPELVTEAHARIWEMEDPHRLKAWGRPLPAATS